MPVVDLFDLPAKGVLIGLDPGTKTLGVAATDLSRILASPVETIPKPKLAPALARFFEIYDDRNGAGLVVGLPLNTDGSQGPRVQSVRTLVSNLLKVRDIPVAYQDERYTTVEADEIVRELSFTEQRRSDRIDAMAAAMILRSALKRLEART
ncbi:MAG: Holliday junction resolvase RuvX [Hyphomonas sp.]|uniref:Holliday junction resolvase RuvX n=1 Tax=Hyphomonas sp. TaxID=87 RepID=UPI0018152CF3|nr:Holliday junction resolvase RuvX [Hyphomonas sp.]MBA3070034.1 Holliday junction resolvase RuvX [Hyphomonas sp.]MBU3919874.1 Holliday junction resolvase RuvX [Alphaproteobacteria bacterium]MBU4060390.1 Holliday junction resolvase RuvX [Alphaproteobacteria bacterium]MBU4163058.1 Holliday junction resolvase RuvX [Alphaproteobacteria bacterium]